MVERLLAWVNGSLRQKTSRLPPGSRGAGSQGHGIARRGRLFLYDYAEAAACAWDFLKCVAQTTV
jgi:hypothetical protein